MLPEFGNSKEGRKAPTGCRVANRIALPTAEMTTMDINAASAMVPTA